MLDMLLSLESQWKETARLMLNAEHDDNYLVAPQVPHELEVAITYWSARTLMSKN